MPGTCTRVVHLQGRKRGRALGAPLRKKQENMRRRVIRVIYQEAGCIPLLRHSMQHNANWSFLRLDQSMPYTSRICSCHGQIGRVYKHTVNTCHAYSHQHRGGRIRFRCWCDDLVLVDLGPRKVIQTILRFIAEIFLVSTLPQMKFNLRRLTYPTWRSPLRGNPGRWGGRARATISNFQ